MLLQYSPFQHTIGHTVSFCGVGLHSGRNVMLSIHPANENSGLTFKRIDLPGSPEVKAHMSRVVDTRLATTLGEGDVRIGTTEHLLAALAGYGIDNAIIELDSNEVPIMDGSAAPFLQRLKTVGRKRQQAYRQFLRIKKELSFIDGDSRIVISPYDGYRVSGTICFPDEIIKTQSYSLDVSLARFVHEISRARTFGYVEQVEELWANGLALGVTLENVIAIHWNRRTVLNEAPLRYRDEFIRHKVLDMIGDLALLGCPIMGHVQGYKPGHTQHLGFMEALLENTDCWDLIEVRRNGCKQALEQAVASSRNAGEILFPLLQQRPAVAP